MIVDSEREKEKGGWGRKRDGRRNGERMLAYSTSLKRSVSMMMFFRAATKLTARLARRKVVHLVYDFIIKNTTVY